MRYHGNRFARPISDREPDPAPDREEHLSYDT